MEKILKFLFSKPLLLIIFLGLVPLIWFKNDLLLAGGDAYGLINPSALTNFTKYVWNIKSNNGGGLIFSIPNLIPGLYFFTFFQSLGWSLILAEKLWFLLLFLLPGLSMYYLMREIYNKNWAKIISSTFYMFNLFLVVISIVQTNIKPVFIALPLMLLFWIKGLNEVNGNFLKYSVLISLCSLIYAGSNVNVPSVVAIPMTLFAYLIFFLISSAGKKEKIWRSLKFTLVTFVCYLLLNLWWITNFVVNIIPGADSIKNGVSFTALGAGGIMEFLRLLGSWGWKSGSYNMYYFPFAFNYDKPFLLILTFSLTFLVFLAILLRPKNKNIIFFSFLAIFGLFFAKGGAAPFGSIYIWLWNNLPGFWMFREPFAKFTPVTVFAYSILLGISADLIDQRLKGLKFLLRHQRFYKLFSKNFFPFLVMVTVLVVSYPLISGEFIWDYWNGSMRTLKVEIPQYWQEMKGYIVNHNLQEERLLIFPASGYGNAYNWQHGFSSAGDIAGVLLSNPTIVNSTVLLGRADMIINQLFNKLLERNFNLKSYLSLLNTQYVLQENDADWRYSGGQMLSPSEANQKLEDFGLKKVAEFGKFTPDYLAKIPNSEPIISLHDELYEELTNQPALILYKTDDQYFLPHFYIPQNIVYANGSIENLPNILGFKDYINRSGIYLENSKLGDLEISKSVDEIFVKGDLESAINEEKLGVTYPEVSLPYVHNKPEGLRYQFILMKEQFDKWKVRNEPEKLLEKHLLYASKRIAELINFEIKDTGQVNILLENYKHEFESARGKTNDINKLKAYLEAHRKIVAESNLDIKIKDKARDIFNNLEDKIAGLKPKQDYSRLVYKINIPKKGNYEVLVKNNPGVINWTKLEEKNLDEGEQELTLPFSGMSENLVDENLKIKDYPIKDYSPNYIYRISFDYEATQSGSFFVAEGKTGKTAETQLSSTGDEFRNFEMFFKSSPEATNAAVLFLNTKENNVQVQQILQPTLMLRGNKPQTSDLKPQIPKITFVKINPTKYRVKVEGAVDPYTLVFSESFHQGWKAYITNHQPPITNDQYGEIVASYFDGDIKEGTHRNTFLEKATFETWGKKPLSEDKHLMVNGYANSWYIIPEDAGGRHDYELIVEFVPQRLFYIGLGISGLTLFGCLGYLFFAFFRKKWKKIS